MSLIVEDGTAVVGAESYVTTAFADAYWLARNNTDWDAADAESKEAALRQSCQYLDNAYEWKGSRRQGMQYLGWPRTFWNMMGYRDGRYLDITILIPGVDTVPLCVKNAQCELAMEVLLNGPLMASLDRGGLIHSARVGSLEVVYESTAPGSKRFPFIDLILKDIIDGSNVQSFGSADAHRG